MTIAADLSKEEVPAQTVKEAVEKLGGRRILCSLKSLGTYSKSTFMREFENNFFSGLDVLVNSAGILMSGSVETLDIADYDKVRKSTHCTTQGTVSILLLLQNSFPGDEHKH